MNNLLKTVNAVLDRARQTRANLAWESENMPDSEGHSRLIDDLDEIMEAFDLVEERAMMARDHIKELIAEEAGEAP